MSQQKSKVGVRVAQAISAVLAVAIMVMVGLLINRAFNKAGEGGEGGEARQPVRDAFTQPVGTVASGVLGPLVPAGCAVGQSHIDQGRLMLVIEGDADDCARIVIINSRDGSLIRVIALKG